MSARRKTRPARALQSVLGYVLAVLLAVSLAAACVLTLVSALLTDQALHERVAQDRRVLGAQSVRIGEMVSEMAERWSFAPETVLDVLAQEGLEAYNREIVGWWMSLMGEEPSLEAPLPDTEAMEEAVRADDLFRENTSEFMRRTIAQDDVAYPIAKAMREIVMPLRVSLISLGMPKVLERVDMPRLIGLLGTAKAALFALAAALLLLILFTQGKRRWVRASAGVMAAFIVLAVLTVLAARAPAAIAEYSQILSLQAGVLASVLAAPVLLTEAGILLASLLLLLPALLKKREEAYHGRHERKRA